MATPQELYDETKTRLDLNIAKAQMLEREIQQKVAEKNQLMQPIMEDQGALKQLEKLSNVVAKTRSLVIVINIVVKFCNYCTSQAKMRLI